MRAGAGRPLLEGPGREPSPRATGIAPRPGRPAAAQARGPSPAPPPTCCGRRGRFHLHLPLSRARPGSGSPQTRPRPARPAHGPPAPCRSAQTPSKRARPSPRPGPCGGWRGSKTSELLMLPGSPHRHPRKQDDVGCTWGPLNPARDPHAHPQTVTWPCLSHSRHHSVVEIGRGETKPRGLHPEFNSARPEKES